ncbi:MAG: hypothetical protein ACOYNF_16050 [Rhodoferax sp.]
MTRTSGPYQGSSSDTASEKLTKAVSVEHKTIESGNRIEWQQASARCQIATQHQGKKRKSDGENFQHRGIVSALAGRIGGDVGSAGSGKNGAFIPHFFAAHCFNAAWDLMDKTGRSAEDDLMMTALSQASIYHWRQRADCTPRHLSMGYWQAARVAALLGHATEARRWAQVCLGYSAAREPFYLGYALEALARAAWLVGDPEETRRQVGLARLQAMLIDDPDERAILVKDLDQLT